VIYMARELVKLGWNVTVYADPDHEQVDQGVVYVPYYKFNPRDQFNILVLWRNPTLLDYDLKAKKFYLWAHDVQNNLEYTGDKARRVNKLNKLIVLSPYHRANVPAVPDDKILLSSNGINLN